MQERSGNFAKSQLLSLPVQRLCCLSRDSTNQLTTMMDLTSRVLNKCSSFLKHSYDGAHAAEQLNLSGAQKPLDWDTRQTGKLGSHDKVF